jgi:hypothetical protein
MSVLLPLCDTLLIGLAILLFTRRGLRLIHPATVYFAYHFLTVTLRLWGLWAGSEYLFSFVYLPSQQDYFRAFLINEFGLMAICCGFLLVSDDAQIHSSDRGTPLPGTLVLSVAVVAIVAGLASAATYEDYQINKDIVKEVTTIDGKNVDVNSYVTGASLWLAPSLILLIYRYGPRKFLLAAFGIALASRLYVSFNRFAFILPACIVFAVLLEGRGRKWPTFKQAFAVLFLFAVFSAGKGFVRSVVDVGWNEDTVPEAISNLEENLSGNGEVSFFDQCVMVAGAVPERAGYLLGRYYYVPFVMWIPRQYWADKPTFGEEIYQLSKESGLPMGPLGMIMTLHGANYANFGYAGVIILGVAIGWLSMLGHRRANVCAFGSAQKLMYIAFWGSLIQFYRDGLTGLPILLFNTGLPIYLACLLAMAHSRLKNWLGAPRPRLSAAGL